MARIELQGPYMASNRAPGPYIDLQDPTFDLPDPDFDLQDPTFDLQDPDFDLQDPGFGPQDPGFGPQDPGFGPWYRMDRSRCLVSDGSVPVPGIGPGAWYRSRCLLAVPGIGSGAC